VAPYVAWIKFLQKCLFALLPPLKKEVMFLLRSVCLSVRRITSCERILTKFLGGVGHGSGTKWLNFGDDPDHRPDPWVRSPKFGFTGLSKKYPVDSDQRCIANLHCKNHSAILLIMLAFGGDLYSLSTSSFLLIFIITSILFLLLKCLYSLYIVYYVPGHWSGHVSWSQSSVNFRFIYIIIINDHFTVFYHSSFATSAERRRTFTSVSGVARNLIWGVHSWARR